MKIKELTATDFAAYKDMLEQLYKETNYMLYSPQERTDYSELQKQFTADQETSGSTVWVVADDQKIYGFLGFIRKNIKKVKHCATINIGLLSEIHGQGFAKALLEEMFIYAKKIGVTRLELTVMEENTVAIAMYESVGFKKEGLKEQAIYWETEDRFINDCIMAKFL